MIAKVNVSKIINAPVSKAWPAIRSIGGLDRWFPIITSCRVEGAGVGAVRILELSAGRPRYDRFQLPFPVEKYLGTVEVGNAGDGQAGISWSIQVDVSADKKDDLIGLVEGTISDGIDGLEEDLQA